MFSIECKFLWNTVRRKGHAFYIGLTEFSNHSRFHKLVILFVNAVYHFSPHECTYHTPCCLKSIVLINDSPITKHKSLMYSPSHTTSLHSYSMKLSELMVCPIYTYHCCNLCNRNTLLPVNLCTHTKK